MFIYRNRPMQLGYLDGTNGMQFLPCWVANHSDLAAAVASIRERRWGNIPAADFSLCTWNNYTGSADGETALWVRILGATGDTPATSPTYLVLRNNLYA